MALRRRRNSKRKRSIYQKRKICRFCSEKSVDISYKDFNVLKHFITERGKIIPRRISGNCAKHQRQLTRAIKRSRGVSIMPFTVSAA